MGTGVLSGLFVAAGLLGIARSFGEPQYVMLDAHAVTAPRTGVSRTTVTVPYRDITDLRVMQVQRQRFLVIHHRTGKLTINRAMLPNHDTFEALADELGARCLAVATGQVATGIR